MASDTNNDDLVNKKLITKSLTDNGDSANSEQSLAMWIENADDPPQSLEIPFPEIEIISPTEHEIEVTNPHGLSPTQGDVYAHAPQPVVRQPSVQMNPPLQNIPTAPMGQSQDLPPQRTPIPQTIDLWFPPDNILPPVRPPRILPSEHPDIWWDQLNPVPSSTCSLCCIGFNPETSRLSAIISVKLVDLGFEGDDLTKDAIDRCIAHGTIASVGFWIIEPSRVVLGFPRVADWDVNKGAVALDPNKTGPYDSMRFFIGEGHVNLFDITRNINSAAEYGYLKYSIDIPLSPVMEMFIRQCSERPEVPILHAVLKLGKLQRFIPGITAPGDPSLDFVTDTNYDGVGLNVVDKMSVDIQFLRKGRYGEWKFIDRTASSPDITKVFPVHVAQLKNKKILMFAGSGNIAYDRNPETPRKGFSPNLLTDSAALFDPDSDSLQEITHPNYDVFCCGHSVLDDGRVLVAGGTWEYQTKQPGDTHGEHWPGVQDIALFDSDTNTWSRIVDSIDLRTSQSSTVSYAHMAFGRWYPSTLVLGNGRVLIMGGHTSEDDPTTQVGSDNVVRHENRDLEILTSTRDFVKNRWYFVGNGMPSTGDTSDGQHLGTFPRLHLMPNGDVFVATYVQVAQVPKSGAEIIRLESSALWTPPDKYYPLGQWRIAPSGVSNKHYISHHGSTSVLLPLVPDGNGQYSPHVMIIPDQNSYYCNPLKDSEWTPVERPLISSLPFGDPNPPFRLYGNTVILPDATVLLVGGINWDNPSIDPPDSRGVLSAEIYDPFANNPLGEKPGKWMVVEPMRSPRNYHGVAILLYDGRVLIGGSNPGRTEVRNLSLEIYSPDNLRRGPRPQFAVTPERVSYGGTLKFRFGEGWQWSYINKLRIGLMRLNACTHAFGFDQRYVALSAPSKVLDNAKEFSVTIPNNMNLLPVGYYMVFLVSNAGAPSVGHIIQIVPAMAGTFSQ